MNEVFSIAGGDRIQNKLDNKLAKEDKNWNKNKYV